MASCHLDKGDFLSGNHFYEGGIVTAENAVSFCLLTVPIKIDVFHKTALAGFAQDPLYRDANKKPALTVS